MPLWSLVSQSEASGLIANGHSYVNQDLSCVRNMNCCTAATDNALWEHGLYSCTPSRWSTSHQLAYWLLYIPVRWRNLSLLSFQQWSFCSPPVWESHYKILTISNSLFSCRLTINITSHSMENLTFHSLLRQKMIILPIFSLPHFHISP